MPRADAKNISYKNEGQARVGDLVTIILLNAHQQPETRRAVLVAANAEIERNNGRYILESQLHALPVCTISELELVEQSSQPAKEFKFPTDRNGLRLDGPTFDEFVKEGYKPAAYPPQGFAVVLSPEEQDAADIAVAEVRRKKYQPVPPATSPATSPATPAADHDEPGQPS